MRTNSGNRHEGPTSLVLRCAGGLLQELSLDWTWAPRLGDDAGHGPVLFATRIQSVLSGSPLLAAAGRCWPLLGLKSKHRARARQRREHWRQIAESAQASLSPYLHG